MAKITMATVKSFVRRNKGKLLIRVNSRFFGWDDTAISSKNARFLPAAKAGNIENTLGIDGAWFVGGGSKNYLDVLNEPGLVGFAVQNCCGSFDLAVKK